MRSAFLAGYAATAGTAAEASALGPGGLLPRYELDKALYELRYELNNRPDWVDIPLRGLLELVADPTPGADHGPR